MENIKLSNIEVYPNPFSDFINIDIGDKKADVKLLNLLGQVSFLKSLQQGENLVSGINIPAGVYILRVQTADSVLSKIVVKK